MKIFIVLVAVLISAQALTEKEQETINQECMAENGINSNATGIPEDKMLEDYKKHTLCMLKKIGLVNEAGEVQTEALKTLLITGGTAQEKIDEVLQTCIVQKQTPEEATFEFLQCLTKVTGKTI